MLSSEEHAAAIYRNFVETFTPSNRPDLLLLTGGEPLLRPRLVEELANRAHAVGTRVCMISGMFFARQPKLAPAIDKAIANIDHFTASLDIFHERQVARSDVFRVLRQLVDRGQDVSLQVVGLDEHDPYLVEVTRDIERYFDGQVPALVAQVGAAGRAKEWLERHEQHLPADVAPVPCGMAAWPVLTFDGTVVACCNQSVVDGPVPPHLRLGHASVDDWATIRDKCLRSTMLRAIRVFGPPYIATKYGAGKVKCDGYCSTCYRLSDDAEIAEGLEPVMSRHTMHFVEQQVAALEQTQFSYGVSAYSHLMRLGYRQDRSEACVT